VLTEQIAATGAEVVGPDDPRRKVDQMTAGVVN